MKVILLTMTAFCSAIVFSQILDFNNVRALTNNNGILFQDATASGPAYEIPKGSGNNTMYTAALWCAAVDDTGGIHLAAARFNQNGQDYFQGPFSTTNSYQDANYQASYANSSWTVSKTEIQSHIAGYNQPGYILTANIANWPGNGVGGLGLAQNLAPFVDVNNNGIYEPMQGDYPDIRGDKAVYKIMNDASGVHTETGGLALGIEVHTMLYQYASTDYLDNTTFMHVRVFNRSADDYDNFKLALFADFDLGNPTDDFIGCDSTQNLMYIYNGDNNDESSGPASGYGLNPPAFGITSLNKEMKHFGFFTNGGPFPYTDPISAAQYLNFMSGMWANGTPWTHNGMTVNFMHPGNPNDANTWSEVTDANPSGDRRGVMTVADENLPSGEYVCYDFALLYARDLNNNNLLNVNILISQSGIAKTDFEAVTCYNCDVVTLGMDENVNASKVALFPNPSNGDFVLSFGDENLTGKIIVTDMSGRVVLQEDLHRENVKKLKLDNKTGIYNVLLLTDEFTVHKRLIINE